MTIKKFENFNNGAYFEEIKGIIDDRLIDLKDLNENFSWKFTNLPRITIKGKEEIGSNLKSSLEISFHDYIDIIEINAIDDIKRCAEILNNLFQVLSNENLLIYDQSWQIVKDVTKPSRNSDWVLKRTYNPITLRHEISHWQKSFMIYTDWLTIFK